MKKDQFPAISTTAANDCSLESCFCRRPKWKAVIIHKKQTWYGEENVKNSVSVFNDHFISYGLESSLLLSFGIKMSEQILV